MCAGIWEHSQKLACFGRWVVWIPHWLYCHDSVSSEAKVHWRCCLYSPLLLHFQLLSKPIFFRQNSERRSFKLPDIRKLSRDGTGSPSKISPPSTPSSPDDTFFSLGDPQNGKRRRKIPKVNLGFSLFCLASSRQEWKYVSSMREYFLQFQCGIPAV